MFVAFARFQHNANPSLDAEPNNLLEPKVHTVNKSYTTTTENSLDSEVGRDTMHTLPSFGGTDVYEPVGMTDRNTGVYRNSTANRNSEVISEQLLLD